MLKTCYIFGAAEGLPKHFTKNKDDIIIAADAGIKHLNTLGIMPDLTVGDFDSLGFVPDNTEIIKHPVMKDDTDMLLAVKIGLNRGFSRFVIYGGAGGRPDHTFANYQALNFIAENGGIGFMSMGDFTVTALKNSSVKFSGSASGTISVFSMGEKIKGVTLNGLLYPLKNATVTNLFPIGVSNEFIGKPSKVIIGDGNALIFWKGDENDITEILPLK